MRVPEKGIVAPWGLRFPVNGSGALEVHSVVMHTDSALARLARDALVAAAALLAVATPLTHLALQVGLSFRSYAIVVAVAVIGVGSGCVALRRRRESASRGADDTAVARRAVLSLLAVCALAAVLPVVVQHATADDAVYLPSVVHSLAHPADAMSFEVRYAWFGDPLVVSPHWNVATPFDYVEGVLAYTTGVRLLTVRYLIAPPLIAALLPLAFFYLLTRFGFGDTPALAGCLLFGAALALMRETQYAPGALAACRSHPARTGFVQVRRPSCLTGEVAAVVTTSLASAMDGVPGRSGCQAVQAGARA